MLVTNIPKPDAEQYKLLLNELRPDWVVEIIEEDVNLYRLGFVREIPCSIKIEVSVAQIEALKDEIIDMEIAAYSDEEILFTSRYSLSEEEKKRQQYAKACMRKYNRYTVLESLLLWMLNEYEGLNEDSN